MTPDQRRQAVGQILAKDPATSQAEIAKQLGCSQKTISRDIAAMTSATNPVLQGVSSQVNRGDSLVARLRGEMAEQGLIPTSTEVELLAVVKDIADRIQRLQRMVKRDGESRKTKDGRVVLHPALAEIRQCESTLSRVIGGISTMAEPQVNRSKQRAAQTRWRTHNRQRGLTTAETPVGHG